MKNKTKAKGLKAKSTTGTTSHLGKAHKTGKTLAAALALSLGAAGFVLPGLAEAAVEPLDNYTFGEGSSYTYLRTSNEKYWMGIVGPMDTSYDTLRFKYNMATPSTEDRYWRNADSAMGDNDYHTLLYILLHVMRKQYPVDMILGYIIGGFSELTVEGFPWSPEAKRNGVYHSDLSYTWVKDGSFTLHDGSHIYSPLFYIDEGSTTNILKGSTATLGIGMDTLDLLPVVVKQIVWALVKITVVRRSIQDRSWEAGANVYLNGGNLVVMWDTPVAGHVKMDSGNFISIYNTNAVNLYTKSDAITGGTYYNVASKLYLSNDGTDKHDYGNFSIGDIGGIVEDKIGTGMTYIGKPGQAAAIDWGSNSLDQLIVFNPKGSSFTTTNMGNIYTSMGFNNEGTLNISQAKDKATQVNNNTITGNGILNVAGDINNHASIHQAEIKINPGFTLLNSRQGLGAFVIDVNKLTNNGKLYLKDGYTLNVNAPATALGNLILDNNNAVRVYKTDGKITGTIEAFGAKENTLTLEDSSYFDGALLIGDETEGDQGTLRLNSTKLTSEAQITLAPDSHLIVGTDSSLLFAGSNDNLNGTVKISGTDATATFGKVDLGDQFGIKASKGTLNIGLDDPANQEAGIAVLDTNNSYIGEATVNIAQNGNLVIGAKGAKANISGSNDSWKGTITLEEGTLDLTERPWLTGTNGTLKTIGGTLNVHNDGALHLGAGSSIAENTYVNTEKNIITYGGWLDIKGGQATLNGKGDSETLKADTLKGLLTLEEGTLTLKDKAEFGTATNTGYQQTGGTLNLDDSKLTLNGASFGTVSWENSITGNSLVNLTNGADLIINNGKTNNSAVIKSDNDNNYLELIKGDLGLQAGSRIGKNDTLTIGAGNTLYIGSGSTEGPQTSVTLGFTNKGEWKGELKVNTGATLNIESEGIKTENSQLTLLENSQGRVNVNANAVLSSQDTIKGGQLTVAERTNLSLLEGANIATNITNNGAITGYRPGGLVGTLTVKDFSTNASTGTIALDTVRVAGNGTLINNNRANEAITAKNIEIETRGTLNTYANALNSTTIENNGSLELRAGEASYDVTGTGALRILDKVALNGLVQQKSLNIATNGALTLNHQGAEVNKISDYAVISGTLTNNGEAIINGLVNDGTVNGTGSLYLAAANNNEAGTIKQDKLTFTQGNSVNENTTAGAIEAKQLAINKNATLTTNAEAIKITDEATEENKVINSGTLAINGGTITFDAADGIEGRGTLQVIADANLAEQAIIANNIATNKGTTLTVAKGESITGGSTANRGTIKIQGGNLSQGITLGNTADNSKGQVVFSGGSAENKGTIQQQVAVEAGSILTSDIAGLQRNIANDGTTVLTGSEIKKENTITGTGRLEISNNMTNKANITQNTIAIAENTNFTNATEGVLNVNGSLEFNGTLTNNGTVNAIINNKTEIKGTGTLNIKGQSSNSGEITQGLVTVAQNSGLKNDGTINAAFKNESIISGEGTINMTGNSVAGADVSSTINNTTAGQSLTIKDGVAMTGDLINSNGGVIDLQAKNQGIYLDGAISSNSAPGAANGVMKLESGGRVNVNGSISGQSITLKNGTLALGKDASLANSSLTITGEGWPYSGGGRLDMTSLSKENDTVELRDLRVESDKSSTGLSFDANLAAGTSDQIVISGTASGSEALHLHAINITQDAADFNNEKTLHLITTANGGTIDRDFKIAEATAASDIGVYKFSQADTGSGDVIAAKIGKGITLTEAIENSDLNSYSLTENQAMRDTTYGGVSLSGTDREFTIFGNGNTLAGSNEGGINVFNGDYTFSDYKQSLTIKDLTITGFETRGGTDLGYWYTKGFALTNIGDIDDENATGALILDGVTMRDNTWVCSPPLAQEPITRSTDISNSGHLVFTGSASNISGDIIGNWDSNHHYYSNDSDPSDHSDQTYGDITINSTTLNMGGSIYQHAITINENGMLSVGAGNIHLRNDGSTDTPGLEVVNNGILKLNSSSYSTLSTDVKGTGTTLIAGTVNNGLDNAGHTIKQQLAIGTEGIYNGKIDGVLTGTVANIVNDGTLNLVNTTSHRDTLNEANTLTGSGTLNIGSNAVKMDVVANTAIAQGNINVAAGSSLAANKDLTVAATLTNSGSLDNNEAITAGKLVNTGFLHNDGSFTGALENSGKIDGDGTADKNVLNITGSSLNKAGGTIEQNEINVLKGTLVNQQANTTTPTAAIVAKDGLSIAEEAALVSNADAIEAIITNDGTYQVTGGTIKAVNSEQRVITGEGNTLITGAVVNNTDIEQSRVLITAQDGNRGSLTNEGTIKAFVAVGAGAELNSDTTKIQGSINNDGTYNAKGSSFENNTISGSGTLNLAGMEDAVANKISITQGNTIIRGGQVLDNQGSLAGGATINQGGTLISNATNINADLTNNGSYNVTGGTIYRRVTGSGTTNILDHTLAIDTLSQERVNISDGVVLSANADNIQAEVYNDVDDGNSTGGIYQVTGGTISHRVTGTNGILLVQNDVKSISDIKQDYVQNEGSLTNQADLTTNDLNNLAAARLYNEGTLAADYIENAGTLENRGLATTNTLNNTGMLLGSNGTLNINASSKNAEGASIWQREININQGYFENLGSLTATQLRVAQEAALFSNADAITATIVNDGLYSVSGGHIRGNVVDSGAASLSTLNIMGQVTNEADITQTYMEVDGDEKSAKVAELTNNGNMTIRTLWDNSGVTHNRGIITAPLFNDGLVDNNGLIIGQVANNVSITGNGTLVLTNTSSNEETAILTQGAVELQKGLLTNKNTGWNTFNPGHLTISDQAELDSNADAVSGSLTVDGLYTITGGNSHTTTDGKGTVWFEYVQDKGNQENQVQNTGSLGTKYVAIDHDMVLTNAEGAKLKGDYVIVEGAYIGEAEAEDLEAIDGSQGATLNAYAKDVTAFVQNDGTYNLNSGLVTKGIAGDGSLNIKGSVTNSSGNYIDQGTMDVVTGASLTNNGKVLVDMYTTNRGTLTNNDYLSTYLTNEGIIAGKGQLLLTGNYSNKATSIPFEDDQLIDAEVKAAIEGINSLLGSVANYDGLDPATLYKNTNTGSINQSIIQLDTRGILDNTQGNIIADQVNVLEGATVTSNATNLQAVIANEGTYHVLGGTISKNITGSGHTLLEADTTNLATVDQGYVELEAGKRLVNYGALEARSTVGLVDLLSNTLNVIQSSGLKAMEDKLSNIYGADYASRLYSLANNGAIENLGHISGVINNKGTITGTGLLNIYGQSDNADTAKVQQSTINILNGATLENANEDYGSLKASYMGINMGGTLKSNAFAVAAPIYSDGEYIITGSPTKPNIINYDVTNTITGAGNMQVGTEEGGYVINDANIRQGAMLITTAMTNNEGHTLEAAISIGEKGSLTSNASELLTTEINNAGTLSIRGSKDGGTISYSIIGSKNDIVTNIEETSGDAVANLSYIAADGSVLPVVYRVKATDDETKGVAAEYLVTRKLADGTTKQVQLKFTMSKDEKGYFNNYSNISLDAEAAAEAGVDYTGQSFDTDGFDALLKSILPEATDLIGNTLPAGTTSFYDNTTIAYLPGGKVQIDQAQVNVLEDVTLSNYGDITAEVFNNKGITANAETIAAKVLNEGTITGEGTLYAKAGSETWGDISNVIAIANTGSLTAHYDSSLTGTILNHGTLTLLGTGNGVLVSGNITNAAAGAPQGTIQVGSTTGTAGDRATLSGNVLNQNINLHSGTLNIDQAPGFSGVNLTIDGSELQASTLNTRDTGTNELALEGLHVAAGSSGILSFDLNDTFKINDTSLAGEGGLSLGAMTLDINRTYKDPVLFLSNTAIAPVAVGGSAVTYTSKNKYEIAQSNVDGHYLQVTTTRLSPEEEKHALNLAIDDLNQAGHNNVTFIASGTTLQDQAIHGLDNAKNLLITADLLSSLEENTLQGGNAQGKVGGLLIGTGSSLTLENLNGISGFKANSSTNDGGFADNKGTLNIYQDEPIRLSINNNSATNNGGALNNSTDDLDGSAANVVLNAAGTDFTGNSAGKDGGAINNAAADAKTATADLAEGTFAGNSATGNGGAVSNSYTGSDSLANSLVTLAKAQLTGNSAAGKGGALYNSGLALLDATVFANNTAQGDGGALYNSGIIAASIPDPVPSQPSTELNNLTIMSNSAGNNGGAIYNAGTGPVTLNDTSLIGNSAGNLGGGVYTEGDTITVIAQGQNVVLKDNTAGAAGTYKNAFHFGGSSGSATLNLTAEAGKTLDLEDGVTAAAGTNSLKISLNSNQTEASIGKGQLILGNAYTLKDTNGSFITANYSLEGGSLQLANEANFSGDGTNSLSLTGGSSLSTLNGAIGQVSLASLATTGTTPFINWGLDLGNNESDQLSAAATDGIAPDTRININAINVDLVDYKLPTSASLLNGLGENAGYLLDPELDNKQFRDRLYDRRLRLYYGADGSATLTLEFERFSPSVMASSVAAQAALETQLQSFDSAFGNVDGLMDKRRETGREQDVWASAYGTVENMTLDRASNIRNIGGGTFFGVDSPVHSLGNGWDAVYSAYGGYNSGKQSYEDVNINQRGGQLGTTALFMKGRFFTGLTANMGVAMDKATHNYGSEKFRSTSYGLANKTGFNIPVENGHATLQISNTLGYARVKVQDYTNASGLELTNGSLGAWQLAPEIKLFGNMQDGLHPYVGVKRAWIFGGKTEFDADQVALDQYKTGAYNEFSLGIDKTFSNRFSASLKSSIRNGSRNGFGVNAQLNWAF